MNTRGWGPGGGAIPRPREPFDGALLVEAAFGRSGRRVCARCGSAACLVWGPEYQALVCPGRPAPPVARNDGPEPTDWSAQRPVRQWWSDRWLGRGERPSSLSSVDTGDGTAPRRVELTDVNSRGVHVGPAGSPLLDRWNRI